MNTAKNRRLAYSLIMLAAGMAMLAYASVPLYRLFCNVTGFGGTTAKAEHAPGLIGKRVITVRFNADIDPNLPWEFKPGQTELRARIGEQTLTYYIARNLTDKSIKGHAVYNVTPDKAGPYFAKIACFCFTDQTLNPRANVHMPISFFLDPSLLDDPAMDDVDTITLSYTFFAGKDPI